MVTPEEKQIEEGLTRIAQFVSPFARCLILIRAAENELSTAELLSLTPDQQGVWRGLSSPNRKLEWSEARRCENELENQLGPQTRTSISHSRRQDRPVVFAAGVAAQAFRVGIDAELGTRMITDVAAKRFVAVNEERFGLTALQIWVVKEALFKANPINADTTLPEYQIDSFDPGLSMGTAHMGQRKLWFSLVKLSEWVVSVAIS